MNVVKIPSRKKPSARKIANPVFAVRIDPALVERMRLAAAHDRRSLAMQVTIALEKYLAAWDGEP